LSFAYGNNEIGTIFPLAEIGRLVRRAREKLASPYPYFHTDACQAPRFLPLQVSRLGVDLVTINSGKIYGPKGTGALYRSRLVELEPVVYGGGQEDGYRSGTVNVPAVVGLAAALQLCEEKREVEAASLLRLRDYILIKLKGELSKVILHGSQENRLSNNINITLPGVEAEWAVIQLDALGIATATGSACSSGRNDERYILAALYGDKAPVEGSIRITLPRQFSRREADRLVAALVSIAVAA
jgi:cysteine desulfurase